MMGSTVDRALDRFERNILPRIDVAIFFPSATALAIPYESGIAGYKRHDYRRVKNFGLMPASPKALRAMIWPSRSEPLAAPDVFDDANLLCVCNDSEQTAAANHTTHNLPSPNPRSWK